MKKPAALIFIIAVFVCLLIPFVGMAVAPTTTTTENRELAAAPALITEEGSVNVAFLSDAGDYFEDHFALRNELVTADNLIRSNVFRVSADSQVIVGRNGWLYFDGTLDDYRGGYVMSERELRNIAHNLFLMQSYVQSTGKTFLFTIAPNKNTLYPQNMPYYLRATAEDHNAVRLVPYLEEYGVNYANLFELFEGEDETLYYLRDTHWNNKGALLAYAMLMEQMDLKPQTIAADDYEAVDGYEGDLAKILLPTAPRAESTQVYMVNPWSYAGESSDVEDSWVETRSDSSTGSLLMYRDSFANALIPFMAGDFSSAYYTKLVPYDMTRVASLSPDFVLIERAERHLYYLDEAAPIMVGPVVRTTGEAEYRASATTASAVRDGDFVRIEGVVDEAVATPTCRILVTASLADGTSKTYEAFSLRSRDDAGELSDWGYGLYLKRADLPSETTDITVTIRDDSVSMDVLKGSIAIPEG